MRERKSFNERTKVRNSDQVNKKYFLVFEGAETEEIYFDAINTRRDELGINPIIELIPLIRDFGEIGWSNPQKIVNRIIENVREAESGEMTYDILLNRIMDYLMSKKIIQGKPQCKTYWKLLKWICEEKLDKSLDEKIVNTDDEIKRLFELIIDNSSIENIADNIVEIIKSLSITYDKEIDKICLIVDRDRDSFVVTTKKNQYQYVMDTCKDNNFNFYVTNPCFEFWLLLHFEDAELLDKEKLKINPYVSSKKKYTEDELCKRMHFKKNRYEAEELVMNLEVALKNEKLFCEDIVLLENRVGSNLGLLFAEIKAPD